ncbi:putative membrane protein [Stenotrophomonas rhizophila]|uniref:TadG family pilus assembly protein n=1 Tax=Stenotrophomonas rhizophila TaxID=216778 RepID=UPI000F4B6D77|nr:TadG family pilus assembly protein [Stenotrophomonas rhizophila]ROP80424.1 putative membrane protein [Stenotrophomonas rhizophila]
MYQSSARAPRPSRQRLRGGMSVTMMLVLFGLVGMLGLVEVGYLYWAKRDAQKVVDLAALAGAQRLDLCAADHRDNSAARGNAEGDNGFAGTLTIQCGNWNPAHSSHDHFTVTLDAGNPLNAVKVEATRSIVPFFGQNARLPMIRAQAVATRAPPMAVFSVGSQLLRVNGGTPLGNVLSLVGVNLDQTTLLGYDGLAQATITPGGLLQALGIPVKADIGVAEFNALLAAHRVSLGQLLDATATVLTNSGVANVDLTALRAALAARMDLNQLNVQLGSTDSTGGLFARVVAPEGPASPALQADVSALDLITTSIGIASGGNGVAVNNLDILGLVQTRAAIIEPPSIAIGGVGTRAYNAQVRLKIHIDTAGMTLLGPVLSGLGIRLNLPIHADVTNAMGTLESLQCGATPPTATVRVQSSLLRACVGKVGEANQFSQRNVCDAGLQNEQLLTLLGAPLVTDKIMLDTLTHTESVTLAAGETASTRFNQAQVGAAVSGLVSELLRVLSNVVTPGKQGSTDAATATRLADQYLKAANPGNGFYDAKKTIELLRNGDPARGIGALGDWDVPNGVPYPCGLLNLETCFKPGSVWVGYNATVTGEGMGGLSGVLGPILGGLLINRCNSLLSTLLNYNNCVKSNLTSYLQTRPGGLQDLGGGTGVTDPGTDQVRCSGLLCLALTPVLETLKPLLNGVGTLLSQTLGQILGVELGRTDVHMQSIQCTPAQLVY